ncbi:MAG: tyrosine--tRNA ligase [Candidatus Pacebacteria bacterium]|nr:tyrosine--tRNA ligase [Candidatus Paceibacterota bacterium]
MKTTSQKINEILERGIEQIIEKDSLLKNLKSGKKLRIKHGIDPTGPKIHIGRAIQFRKLKNFQDLGHKIVLIIGDFTALIGDASDKQAMRKPLSEKEIKENMKDYERQIGKMLDMKKTEIRYNSEWLNKITVKELLSLAMHFSAQQMIQRRNFKERWEQEKPIGIHELVYPLFQGYDSFAVKADVEIGGADQLFNLKVGREIQKMFGQPPQDIITSKMLSGLDGRKMSTSWGNMVTIVDKPNEMYGKIMSMKDEFIFEYFELCTDIPLSEIKNMSFKKANPRDLKAKLAREIVSIYHGKELVLTAEKEFNKVFREKKLPSSVSSIRISQKSLNILELLFKAKLVSSKAEAKRLINQKGVKIGDEVQTDWQKQIKIKKGLVIQVGKRKFAKIA